MPRKPSKPVNDDGEWVGQAWALWCAGERNLHALGRQFGKDPQTVKKHLRRYSEARAAETADVDATGEYLDGLQHDLREALRTYRDATNPNAKVGALKHATTIREKLAAARGVVTERKATELTGAGGGAVQVEQRLTLDGDAALAVIQFHEQEDAPEPTDGDAPEG